jgi:hypothetical protein
LAQKKQFNDDRRRNQKVVMQEILQKNDGGRHGQLIKQIQEDKMWVDNAVGALEQERSTKQMENRNKQKLYRDILAENEKVFISEG